MTILSTMAVILRWWPRLLRSQSRGADFWYDDWLAVAALPFNLALNAVTIYWASIGLGRHIAPTVGPSQFFTYWIINFFYFTSLALVKISVLLFYSRVFHTPVLFKVALWSSAGLVMAWWAAVNVLSVFECLPIAMLWYRDMDGACLGICQILLGGAAPNVALDAILLFMPLAPIWRLPIKTTRRLSLSIIFMLGYW